MKSIYTSLKIKHKLFLILFFVSFTISIVSLIALQFSFHIYEEQLYHEAAQALILASEIADIKLSEVNKISFDILSDNEVQRYLATIQKEHVSYDRYEALDKLQKKMLTWALSENYISSIQIVDTNGKQYVWGKDTVNIPEARLKSIRHEVIQREGRIVWIPPYVDDPAIVAARMVRSISNLELANLGTLVIRMNPEKLFDSYPGERISNKYNSSVAILSEDGTIYQRYIKLESNSLRARMNKERGYFISNILGEKYLVAYITSRYTGWKFASFLPYANILNRIKVVRVIMIFIYMFIFALVIYFGFLFSRGITKPFERLSAKMKIIEEGNFDKIPKMGFMPQRQGDEIAQLEYDFHLMVEKINTLIKENYLKQIAVKESEFKALQAQINPHFLYNTLESINWMAKLNKQYQIATMVKALGNLLRNSISNKSEVISLRDEMSILEDYVTVQKCRYEERLAFSMDISQDYWECMIPKLSLQPLVENSIQYGLEKVVGVCEIKVWAEHWGEGLNIWVFDNGPGIDKHLIDKLNKGEIKPRGSGIGIKNIDDRIKIIYGIEYGVRVDSEPGEGTKVCIHIPIRGSEDFV